MTVKVKSNSWVKIQTKQFYLVIICLIFGWFNLLVCIHKWTYVSRNSTKYSRILYSKSNDSDVCNDLIQSHRQFDVVLSYYSEDIDVVAQYIRDLRNISNIRKFHPRIIVYNKNSQINNQVLKLLLRADIVQFLPNLGREGGTFLYHISNNYEIIGDHTLFSQAGVEGITKHGLADWYFDRLENQLNTSVGFMPLVNNNMILNYDCGTYRTGSFPRMAQLWSMLEQSLCPPGGQAVVFRGQFLVSGKRIQRRPVEVYKYLYDLITANSSHWLHNDIRSIFFQSTPDNPIFGHTVERIWTILFQCTKPDLYDRCKRRECACYDEV